MSPKNISWHFINFEILQYFFGQLGTVVLTIVTCVEQLNKNDHINWNCIIQILSMPKTPMYDHRKKGLPLFSLGGNYWLEVI